MPLTKRLMSDSPNSSIILGWLSDTMDEQRIVLGAGEFSDIKRRVIGHLIAGTHDEGIHLVAQRSGAGKSRAIFTVCRDNWTDGLPDGPQNRHSFADGAHLGDG